MTQTTVEPTLATKIIGTRHSITAKGGLHYLKGDSTPYFSLTGQEHRSGRMECVGCMHEQLLKHFPHLSDIAALHLSDINGVPMHAEANGWYSMSGALPGNAGEQYHAGNSPRNMPKPADAPRRGEWDDTDYRNPTPDECLQFFADHARVSIDAARELRDQIVAVWMETRNALEPIAETPERVAWSKASWKTARAHFAQWIEEQKPRWKAESDACVAKHGLVVYGDGWQKS